MAAIEQIMQTKGGPISAGFELLSDFKNQRENQIEYSLIHPLLTFSYTKPIVPQAPAMCNRSIAVHIQIRLKSNTPQYR